MSWFGFFVSDIEVDFSNTLLAATNFLLGVVGLALLSLENFWVGIGVVGVAAAVVAEMLFLAGVGKCVFWWLVVVFVASLIRVGVGNVIWVCLASLDLGVGNTINSRGAACRFLVFLRLFVSGFSCLQLSNTIGVGIASPVLRVGNRWPCISWRGLWGLGLDIN